MYPIYPGPFVKFESSPWSEFLHLGVKRSFPANAAIVHPGDDVRHVYFVERGEILTTYFLSPHDSFKLNVIGQNGVAGIFELFAPVPLKSAWHTLAPCICRLFSKECVEKELPKHLLVNLLEQMSLMGGIMLSRLVQGADKRNDVRLARYLLHFVEARRDKEKDDPGRITVVPSITQELSSELLGVHPATFNKLLATFRARGIIGKSKKNSLEILDLDALARLAEGDDER